MNFEEALANSNFIKLPTTIIYQSFQHFTRLGVLK